METYEMEKYGGIALILASLIYGIWTYLKYCPDCVIDNAKIAVIIVVIAIGGYLYFDGKSKQPLA